MKIYWAGAFVTKHRWHKYLLPTKMFSVSGGKALYRWFNIGWIV